MLWYQITRHVLAQAEEIYFCKGYEHRNLKCIYPIILISVLSLIPIGTEKLHVSRILQKAKIEVSEDGTKASAATSELLLFSHLKTK